MKFSDLTSERLTERPVDLMQRLKTKATKTFGVGSSRTQAQGKEVIEKGANILGKQFDKWVATQADPDNIPVDAFLKFLEQTGFLKTGKAFVDAVVKNKATEVSPEDEEQISSDPKVAHINQKRAAQ